MAFQTWVIVDLFGHSRIAGLASEEQIAGAVFLRVDVPDTKTQPGFTRFFGANAIYSITPVDERIAVAAAEAMSAKAVEMYIPGSLLEPGARVVDGLADEGDYDDDEPPGEGDDDEDDDNGLPY